jgi:uncharacterized delta-60 repeat protein
MIQLWKLSGANAMLPLVHRSPFRRVFLVFVLVMSAAVSTVGAAAPTPTPTPTPTPGQLDTTFVPAPGTSDAVNVVIPQPDGKVIAAGRFTFANNVARTRIARFNFNGSLDTGFNPGTGANGEITAAVLQSDGRIIVAGRFTSFNGFTHNGICRLNADGSVDQTFGLGNGISNPAALALALQSDGRIIVGGQFTQVDLTQRNNLARLNTNGSVDLSFDPGNGPNGDVNAIVIQSDGRIIIGGTFIGYNGFARGGIARVLGNGALDPSFDSGVGTGGNVFALALQDNGQIVLGGRFAQYSGTNRTFIARVFGDGSLDFGFNPVPDNWVQSLAVEPDDRILVGGFFTGINGFGRNRVARLNTNGLVDPTFDPGAGCVGSLTSDATQVDSIALQFGRILVGGIFTSYNNQLRDNIVRLFDNAAPAAYDFNQDGKPDYVLFNAVTHQTAVWYLNNNVFLGAAFGPTLPANWNVVGVADFDGDGKPDYLLFNFTSHQTAIWYLSGTTLVSSAFGPSLPNGWDLVAVGDFNADGKPDYVLYNAVTHQTAIWYLNNNVFVGAAFGPTLPANWRVVGVADFNGDNEPDYLLFNSSTGQTAIWYLSGPTLVASAFGPTVVSGYTLIGAADFDRDGKPDYALYNSAMQRTAIWYLNNNAFTSSAFGPSLPANWSLIAP